MKKTKPQNYAFIDAQNLYMGTANREKYPWRIDVNRFRIYLRDKYHVTKAFYFLGCVHDEFSDLYESIQSAGFILVFREHNPNMVGTKKWNIDSDLIFSVMKKLYKKEAFDNIVLVSGDGDYKQMVDFLLEEKRLEKILFPDWNRRSSLYNKLSNKFFTNLDDRDIRKKIERPKTAKATKKRVP